MKNGQMIWIGNSGKRNSGWQKNIYKDARPHQRYVSQSIPKIIREMQIKTQWCNTLHLLDLRKIKAAWQLQMSWTNGAVETNYWWECKLV